VSAKVTSASCHGGAEYPAPAIGVALLVPRIAARSSDTELPYSPTSVSQ
jgi:hypothetical protein